MTRLNLEKLRRVLVFVYGMTFGWLVYASIENFRTHDLSTGRWQWLANMCVGLALIVVQSYERQLQDDGK